MNVSSPDPRPAARRPSASLAISVLALTLSITGAAGALPGRDTVNSGDIVNGSIRSADLKKGAVNSRVVKNDSLKAKDLGPDSATASEIAPGSVSGVAIANGTISTFDIGSGQVTSSDIGTGQVTSSDIGAGAVRASELASTVLRLGPIDTSHSGSAMNGDWAGSTSTAECEPGEDLIAGGARHANNEGENLGVELAVGEIDLDPVTDTVRAIGLNDFYAAGQFRAIALCLVD